MSHGTFLPSSQLRKQTMPRYPNTFLEPSVTVADMLFLYCANCFEFPYSPSDLIRISQDSYARVHTTLQRFFSSAPTR